MARSEVFGVRLRPELREVLRVAAERTERSEGDVVRQLLRQLDPQRLDTGFPLKLVEAQASSRSEVAA